jgi:hypothetical protein
VWPVIWALDSSFDAPTLAQAQEARAAGVGFWWGYLATVQEPGAFNLAAPWSRQAFSNVQQAGLGCGAFVSGLDDPTALRQLAGEWGISLLALDDEDAIRPLTEPDWRPAFLAASGAGLYGLLERHTISAPFRIAALYPAGGCSGATWPTSPAPPEPHGWQCQGTHTEFGLSVDRSALDDWFGGHMTQEEHDALMECLRLCNAIYWEVVSGYDSDPTGPTPPARYGQLKDFPAVVNGVAQTQQLLSTIATGSLTPDLKSELDAIKASVDALSKHLGVGNT